MHFIDTHSHIDAAEFNGDRDEAIARARAAGVNKIFVPAIDFPSIDSVLEVCNRYPNYLFPMIGFHPEEVRADWADVLAKMKARLDSPEGSNFIAIGEVGLDYYWSREYEKEQLEVFERQVEWSIETGLPLMIHCRKAQNEMVRLLRRYAGNLPGGVFHCFTGNEHEAAELLEFPGFMLGIGGVLTFKKSNLPEVLRSVPPERIVLETDSPYMAPVPMRGKRNESAFIEYVLLRLAEVYGLTPERLAEITNANVEKVFPRCAV